MQISVYGTPALIQPGDMQGATAVVIDALRMTSVAVTAKANGCRGLLAVADVEQARALAAQDGALLGGERNALPIEGFDFDNSPLAYTPARVGGRRIIMSTSNGTRAILAAAQAERVLLGAFINAAAVAQAVRDADKLAIVCAGTLGRFTLEDALAAGAILQHLPMGNENDMALAARTLYAADRGDLHAALARTVHYGRLRDLGMQGDLAYCLTEDTHTAVPTRGEGGWFA